MEITQTHEMFLLPHTIKPLKLSNQTVIVYTIHFEMEDSVTMEFTMEEVEGVEGGFYQHLEQHFQQFNYSDIVAIDRVIKE